MNKWIKFFILYLGGTLISLSQLKIVPVMDELSAYLGVSVVQASWLMSVFALAGLILAIPGGEFLSRFGGKKLAVSIMIFLVAGNVLGLLTNNFYILLVSRIIEGISFSLIIMLGVVLINFWFSKEKSGLPIGIYGTFSAFASLIAMNIFRPVSLLWGIKSIWIVMSILSVICLVLFVLYIDAPEKAVKNDNAKGLKLLKEAASNKSIWLLAFSQGCLAFILFTYITVYPDIFKNYYHLSPDTANSYTSLFGLFGIPFGAIAGYIIDKTGKPVTVSLLSFIILALSTLATIYLSPATYILQVFFLSAAISLSSTSIVITASRSIRKEEYLGYSISFIYQLYYIGIFIGAPIILWIVSKASWKEGVIAMTGVAIAGVLGLVLFQFNNRSK